jgi:hypothetical protein
MFDGKSLISHVHIHTLLVLKHSIECVHYDIFNFCYSISTNYVVPVVLVITMQKHLLTKYFRNALGCSHRPFKRNNMTKRTNK